MVHLVLKVPSDQVLPMHQCFHVDQKVQMDHLDQMNQFHLLVRVLRGLHGVQLVLSLRLVQLSHPHRQIQGVQEDQGVPVQLMGQLDLVVQ